MTKAVPLQDIAMYRQYYNGYGFGIKAGNDVVTV
jgi:hypothetical protein